MRLSRPATFRDRKQKAGSRGWEKQEEGLLVDVYRVSGLLDENHSED